MPVLDLVLSATTVQIKQSPACRLAETSPRKKDVINSALYQPLEKEREQQPPPQLEPPVSAFMEMTTEEERRRSDTGCCCCGCCWLDCSWCCRCPWW